MNNIFGKCLMLKNYTINEGIVLPLKRFSMYLNDDHCVAKYTKLLIKLNY